MASLQDTIQIIIAADDQATRVIQGVGSALTGLDANIQDLAAPFADLADRILEAEAAFLALSVAIGARAAAEAIKFQDSLYLVNKQLGDQAPLEDARKKIEELAIQYGTSSNDIAVSMAGFLAAGADYKNAIGLVETAIQFMVAGELDAATATESINKALAGFRIPAEDSADAAEHVGDVLNKIGDISSGKFSEIVTAFVDISGTAKDAGFSMEETAAAVAVMVDKTNAGSESANALKSGLLSLLDPSSEAKARIAELGVNLTDANGVMLSGKVVLGELAGKWGNLTDEVKLQSAAVIFGKDQAGAMNSLLSAWGKSQEYLTQMLDKTTGAVGSMAREMAEKSKLVSSHIDSMRVAWEIFFQRLGDQVIAQNAFRDLVDAVKNLGVTFADVADDDALKPLFDFVRDGFAELTDIINSVAENFPAAIAKVDFSGLIDALGDLFSTGAGVFQAIFGDVDISTVDGLASALQTVTNGLEDLTRLAAAIIDEFKPMAAAIGEVVDEFHLLDEADKVDFGGFLGQAKLIVDAGTGIGLALIAIGRAGADMGGVIDVAFGGIKVVINAFQVAIDMAALGVLSLYEGLLKLSLARAELDLKLSFSDEAEAEAKAQIDRLNSDLNDLRDTMDAVAANAERNGQEFSAGWNQAADGLGGAADEMKAKLDQAEAKLRATGGAANDSAADVKNVRGAMDDAAKAAASLGATDVKIKIDADAAAKVVGKVADDLNSISSGDRIVKLDASGATSEVLKLSDGAALAGVKMTLVKDAAGNLVPTFAQVQDATVKATGAFTEVGGGMDDAAEKAKKATNEGKKFGDTMEGLANNDKIKAIESTIRLNTDQLKLDADLVKTVFSSIDSTVSSTGDLLGSLFGALVNAEWYNQWPIQHQIDLENERRQKALDLQERLANAEISRIEAQVAALNRGDALIQIDGTGLEPELEAFMWKIVKSIRVRANAEFTDYLLGAGA